MFLRSWYLDLPFCLKIGVGTGRYCMLYVSVLYPGTVLLNYAKQFFRLSPFCLIVGYDRTLANVIVALYHGLELTRVAVPAFTFI